MDHSESPIILRLKKATTYLLLLSLLDDVPNAVVLLSYPAECFGIPKALRIFVSTNAALSTQEILRLYTQRWQIELFFRQSK